MGESVDRWNSAKIGAWVGFFLPLIALTIILGILAYQKGVPQLQQYIRWPGTAARILCLATLMNALAFFLATRTNRLNTARGILGVTIVYALVVFILALAA